MVISVGFNAINGIVALKGSASNSGIITLINQNSGDAQGLQADGSFNAEFFTSGSFDAVFGTNITFEYGYFSGTDIILRFYNNDPSVSQTLNVSGIWEAFL